MTTVPSGATGPFAGVGNQTRREAASWWTTGRWRRQALVWSAILAGLFAAMHWVFPAVLPAEAGLPEAGLAQTVRQFTEMAAIVTAIGVVLLTQGLILDERRNGVLEWLLSKPLARPALIVAKFAGHGAGLLVAVIALPWVVAFLLISLAAGEPWNLGRTLAVVGMLGLVAVFHLALVLAISTLTSGRVAVLAMPLVMIVGADLVAAAIPAAFDVLPWSLGRVAGAFLADGVMVTGWPVVATTGWTVALLTVAIYRLGRTEF
jgi:hypothetical protein